MSMVRTCAASVALLILVGLSSGRALGQEPPPPDAPAPKPGEPAKTAVREQTIYIPYTKLREVFEKEGRGVFLPYEKFQELWQAARKQDSQPTAQQLPVRALITAAENEATIAQDVIEVTAKLKIEVLAEGWSEVPLRLSDAAIVSARLGNAPARIVADGQGGYKLLVHNPGKEPQQLELTLEYAKAFTKAPGQNSVSLAAPQAPVNRWRIRIPEADVKVNIQPLIAATEVPEGDKPKEPAADAKGETVVLAFVGAAPSVRIDWTPKSEGAAGLAALANVQAEQQVSIDEGAIRTRAELTYDISRAEVTQLRVEVPADQKVAGVFDPNVRQWSVAEAGPVQRIDIQLFQPTRGSQRISIELEKFSDDLTRQGLSIPAIKALDVGRQQGIVVVRLAGGLRAQVSGRSGLVQVDAGELPRSLMGQSWDFKFRYAALPFELTLAVEKVKPRIEVDQLVEAYLAPESLSLDLLALYKIEDAGVFQLELDVPAGYDVRQVSGRAAAGATEAVVDTHFLSGEDKTRLVVNLARKAAGRVGLWVQLERRLDDANLLRPTGQTSDIALPVPHVAPAGIERASGRLVVYAPESLRINPSQPQGLRSISLADAFAGVESVRDGRHDQARVVMAFAFAQEPASLVLSTERRRPHVTVRQLLVAQIESGVVKYEATFFYDIRYSGVKSLRIDVPQDLVDEIRVQTPGVREEVIDPAPEDLAKGYVPWRLTGETEFMGSATLRLAWEKKLDELAVGKSVDLAIPRLMPMGTDRAWGQIVLTKSETIDVGPTGQPKGLRPIDPHQDLMPGAQVSDAAQVFEFHEDWSLTISATRYKLEEVKRTSVERGVLRMVVTRGREISVQALYRMRSAQQRLEVHLPVEATFDVNPLRINGRPVDLERGDQGEFYVPLVGQQADTPFLLELRYSVPGGPGQLDFPAFPGEPAVQKVSLCAYLPQEWVWLGRRGPWNDEMIWGSGWRLSRTLYPQHTDTELINEVMAGIGDCSGHPQEGFSTGGDMYLFSTLRPEAPPDGALRLTTMHRDWLHGLIVAGLALLGIGLLRRPVSEKLTTVAGLVTLLVLLGVFFPTFSGQVTDGVFIRVVGLVLFVWLAKGVVGWLRRTMAARSSSPPATTATTSPPAATPASGSAAPAREMPPVPLPQDLPQSRRSPETSSESSPPPENPPGGPASGQEGGPSNG